MKSKKNLTDMQELFNSQFTHVDLKVVYGIRLSKCEMWRRDIELNDNVEHSATKVDEKSLPLQPKTK